MILSLPSQVMFALFSSMRLRACAKSAATVSACTLKSLVSMLLFAIFHCIERAFRVDGRAQLFASRGIVTNIVNIGLSILFVTVLGFDIQGLAWASVIGTFLGYCVTLSHFFSKKRTVYPDFSVILSVGKSIMTDIDLGNQDDGVFIRFVDDSAAYNLLADTDSRRIKDDLLEEAIEMGLLKNATYDRVIDLNLITVTVGYPADSYNFLSGISIKPCLRSSDSCLNRFGADRFLMQ